MSRSAVLEKLRSSSPVIAPSMLKCDFGNLQQVVESLESAGGEVLHLDVMDGHFVPNLTYGPVVISRIREKTRCILDAHLMISNPERYLEEYRDAGCDGITVHVEAVSDPLPILQRIREMDLMAGLALNPGTPVETVEAALPACDLVLVMSVEPGFGGQMFQPVALEKLRKLKELSGGELLLSIDGGIGPTTIEAAARAGADIFVSGSAIFEAKDYRTAIEQMRETAGRHSGLPGSDVLHGSETTIHQAK